jgi:hypothetical protein
VTLTVWLYELLILKNCPIISQQLKLNLSKKIILSMEIYKKVSLSKRQYEQVKNEKHIYVDSVSDNRRIQNLASMGGGRS